MHEPQEPRARRGRIRLRVGALGAMLVAVGMVLVAAGGAANAAPPLPAPYSFSEVPTNPALPGRVFAGIAPDGPESAILYGGFVPSNSNSNTPLGDTWRWTDMGWAPLCGTSVAGATGPCGPGTRTWAGMGGAPGGPLLYGGQDLNGGGVQSDAWQWNGSNWTQLCSDDSVACPPGARGMPAAAGTSSQFVLYGGMDGNGNPTDDTWTYDGSWHHVCGTSMSVPCAAGARAGASLSWDGTRFVLFGGLSTADGGSLAADTWTFDGTNWTPVCGTGALPACGPSARALAGFSPIPATEPGYGGALLAGGGDFFSQTTTTLDTDAWWWSGTGWQQLSTPWLSTQYTFGQADAPPAGAMLALPLAAPLTGSCQVLVTGQDVTQSNPLVLTPHTYLSGFSRGYSVPGGCMQAAATSTTAGSGETTTTTGDGVTTTTAPAGTGSTTTTLAGTGTNPFTAPTSTTAAGALGATGSGGTGSGGTGSGGTTNGLAFTGAGAASGATTAGLAFLVLGGALILLGAPRRRGAHSRLRWTRRFLTRGA